MDSVGRCGWGWDESPTKKAASAAFFIGVRAGWPFLPDPSNAYRYFFLPGAGTDRAAGTTEDEAGTETFFGCLGFFASLLPRCCPLGMSISLALSRANPAAHAVQMQTYYVTYKCRNASC